MINRQEQEPGIAKVCQDCVYRKRPDLLSIVESGFAVSLNFGGDHDPKYPNCLAARLYGSVSCPPEISTGECDRFSRNLSARIRDIGSYLRDLFRIETGKPESTWVDRYVESNRNHYFIAVNTNVAFRSRKLFIGNFGVSLPRIVEY